MVKDTDLYRHLLGVVEPWTVVRVEMNIADRRVDVWVAHPDGTHWPCPECGQTLSLFDHAEERLWRHLDSCHFQTYLHARVPRVECPQHRKIQVRVPWAEPNSRFTALFERWSIQVMQETDTAAAAELLGISWDEAWGIQERAVARGLAAKPPLALRQMGVDEKAVGHGQQYMTLVYDLQKSTVEWVGEERKKETLDSFFQSLNPEQRAAIEAVGLDMWNPFIASILEYVPGASEKLVFDRFHIAKHAN
jgi:transposase